MSSIGKLSNSLASFNNENTFALANLKVDFSLIRCDASKEYAPVGLALTDTRRREAESGSIHATACRLGFLFHEMLSDNPNLVKAYGIRTSAILSRPDISPEGTEKDGPFRAFIGADCTSIWASATCGPESISVHLLACMLSRAWDAKTATSIWVELVEERKRRIEAQIQGNKIVHPHSLAAAREIIGRAELAEWDASARSWLRRADLSMARNHTQFRLVVDNLAIPYSSTGSTFEKVTVSWIRAMEVVERLLSKLPQQASDRGVLLAISSWHLYPDLLVFQKEARKIHFEDTLFPSAGVLSLGLEYKGPSDNVARWSLALSHLRYYGDPVRVQSREDLSRVRMDQIWLVVLGAVFRQWDVSYTNFDMAVEWFRDLHVILKDHKAVARTPQLPWIVKLSAAAAAVEKAEDESLIKYGWRRGGKVLGEGDKDMLSPFFGLCNPYVMSAMTEPTDVDCGIAYLRGIATQLDLGPHEALISYTGALGVETAYMEWATISPVESHEPGVTTSLVQKHVRWICLPGVPQGIAQSAALEKRRLEVEANGEICYIVDKDQVPKHVRNSSDLYQWDNPPRPFCDADVVSFRRHKSLRSHGYSAFELYISSQQTQYRAELSLYYDKMVLAAATTTPLQQSRHLLRADIPQHRILLYLKESMNVAKRAQPRPMEYIQRSGLKRKAPMDEATKGESTDEKDTTKHATAVKKDSNASTLLSSDSNGIQSDTTGAFHLMTGICRKSTQWLVPLRALEIAQGLYESLPGASVSLRVIEQDLRNARWLPSILRDDVDSPNRLNSFTDAAEASATKLLSAMSRAASFACIAMFESGRFNIDPGQLNEVIALCSEDSIFVAGILLADPGVTTNGTVIRHLVGNIGHHGMVFMVSPLDPRIRSIERNPQLVEHRPYNGTCADSFRGTSLHLSFTTWKMPLDWQTTGEIDQELFLLEAVVAVQDDGRWVADIDVLEIEKERPDVIERFDCGQDCALAAPETYDNVVFIDTWEELLDPPPCTAVLRAQDNWVARLAVVAVLAQQGKDSSVLIVGDRKLCWHCLRGLFDVPESYFPEIIIC